MSQRKVIPVSKHWQVATSFIGLHRSSSSCGCLAACRLPMNHFKENCFLIIKFSPPRLLLTSPSFQPSCHQRHSTPLSELASFRLFSRLQGPSPSATARKAEVSSHFARNRNMPGPGIVKKKNLSQMSHEGKP
jgi:hypothetical protein